MTHSFPTRRSYELPKQYTEWAKERKVMNVQTKDGLQQDGAGYVVGADHYISPEFAKIEAEKLWYRVWQMACREEEIPNVGDFYTYDIVDQSIIVIRVAPDEITAYYNV